MAVDENMIGTSVIATSDLRLKQYYSCKLDSNGQLVLAGAGENALGPLQNKPNAGEVGDIAIFGKAPAIIGASVTAGNSLTPDAAGKLVPATGSDAVVAIAAESGSTNEIISVYVVTRATSGAIQKSVLNIPIKLAKVANGDVVSNIVLGFPGRIVKAFFVVTDPVTTAAKLATLNLEIGTTDLTGGVIALTSANCTPLGAKVEGSAITANNVFTATDTLSVEASSVTAFVEGEGVLMIVLG